MQRFLALALSLVTMKQIFERLHRLEAKASRISYVEERIAALENSFRSNCNYSISASLSDNIGKFKILESRIQALEAASLKNGM